MEIKKKKKKTQQIDCIVEWTGQMKESQNWKIEWQISPSLSNRKPEKKVVLSFRCFWDNNKTSNICANQVLQGETKKDRINKHLNK